MRPLPDSLHHQVANRLRERIFAGQMGPGAFIDEIALCTELAISRTPLREALKVLASEGLVRHEPRRGSFVNEVTEQDLDDIFPVIALLEGRCAMEATLNANEADIAALDAMHQALKTDAAGKRINEYYASNYAIHEAIITLANNRWLAQTIADLRKILKLARLQQLRAPGRLEQSLAEHMAIFEAIKVRDAQGAELAMRLHLMRQRDALRDLRQQPKSRLLA
jgi:DNA-binding GntR family transcriptional regulator